MDDFPHILENPLVTEWGWVSGNVPDGETGTYRAVTNAIFSVLHSVFGPSAVAFHALTLFLHVANVLMIRAGGSMVLRAARPGLGRVRVERAAWCAAAVFACHPLLSEGVNYAQNASLQLVTFFTQCAVAGVAACALTGRGRWLGVPVVAILLAGYSKDVGFAYAGGSAALTGLVLGAIRLDRAKLRALWAREKRLIVIGTLAGCALLGPLAEDWVRSLPWIFGAALWEKNFVTQGDLFWTYVARIFWPAPLCADHQVPFAGGWSDTQALVKTGLALLVAGAAGAGLWFRRTRGASLLLLLALLPMLARFIYINKELLVEYRMYPVLPWVALLAGWGLSRVWSWRPQVLVVMMAVLLGAGITASARRSATWSDPAGLARDTLRQYPANIRVRTHLQKMALEDGRFDDVVRLADGAEKALGAIEAFNQIAPRGRRYESTMPIRGFICSEHFRTLALVELKSSKEALAHADAILARLEQHDPECLDPQNKKFETGAPLVEVRQMLLTIGTAYDRLKTHPGDPAALAEIQRARDQRLAVP